MTTPINEKSLLAEILDDIREKIKKIPLLAQIFIFNSNSYFSKLTTVSFYYATFVSVIYLILFTIIYMRDPYETFEPGNKQGSTTRDPRKIIGKSIRELSMQIIGRQPSTLRRN